MNNKKILNGRLTAIFFIFSTASFDLLASEIYFSNQFAINHGLLDESYWKAESFNANPRKVLAYTDVSIGATSEIAGQTVFVERRKIATLNTNSNSLLAASRETDELDYVSPGKYPLVAHLNKFQFEAAGLLFNGKLDQDVEWSLLPKFLKLNKYSIGDADGELNIESNAQHLNASVSRQGSSKFGYTTQPTNIQIGTGVALDANVKAKIDDYLVNLEIVNLFSRIPVNGAYYSERNYQINTQSNALVFNSTPSLTGTYGQIDANLQLPRILKADIANGAPSSNWMQKAGVISFQGGYIPWVAISYKLGEHNLSATTYQMNNLFLTYEKKNILVRDLSFEATMGVADHGRSQLLLTKLRYMF